MLDDPSLKALGLNEVHKSKQLSWFYLSPDRPLNFSNTVPCGATDDSLPPFSDQIILSNRSIFHGNWRTCRHFLSRETQRGRV